VANGFTISGVGARAGEDEKGGRMPGENRGRLFDEPCLVFNGVDATNTQKNLSAVELREGVAGSVAMIAAVKRHRDTVTLDEDAFCGVLLSKEARFLFVGGHDCVSVAEQAMRLKKEPEQFAPFPTADEGSIEALLYVIGQVEHAAMDGDDEGDLSLFGNGEADAADASEGVGVDQRNVLLSPKGRDELEGHEIAAAGDEFTFSLLGDAEHRDEGVESLHVAASHGKRVMRGFFVQPRAIDDGGDAVIAQTVAETLHRCFGPAPLGGIVFSEQMDCAHNWFRGKPEGRGREQIHRGPMKALPRQEWRRVFGRGAFRNRGRPTSRG